MAIFGRSSPAKNLTTAIQKQRALRDDLERRLETAKAMVADSNTAAKQMALTGADDASLDAADTSTVKAEKRVHTLTAALVEADQELADLERQRDELDDQRKRRETCEEIRRVSDELQTAGKAIDTAVIALSDAAKQAGLIIVDGKGLELFARQLRDSLPLAVEQIVNAMGSHITAVLNGQAPAVIGRPEPALAPAPPQEPTVKVFSMTPVKWRANGAQQRSAKFQQIEVPTAAAARALKTGRVIAMTDPRWKALHVGFVAAPPAHACDDLDDVNLKPLKPVFGPDILKRDAQMREVVGGNQSWLRAERG